MNLQQKTNQKDVLFISFNVFLALNPMLLFLQMSNTRYGMNLDGPLYSTTIPILEFSIEFQSNNLIYQKEYTKRQQVIYSLILLLREEGLGYRKISRKLNQWGIKTNRGKKWFNTSVSSVLKRKHQRDVLFDEIRNRHYPTKISKFEVNYYTFD